MKSIMFFLSALVFSLSIAFASINVRMAITEAAVINRDATLKAGIDAWRIQFKTVQDFNKNQLLRLKRGKGISS